MRTSPHRRAGIGIALLAATALVLATASLLTGPQPASAGALGAPQHCAASVTGGGQVHQTWGRPGSGTARRYAVRIQGRPASTHLLRAGHPRHYDWTGLAAGHRYTLLVRAWGAGATSAWCASPSVRLPAATPVPGPPAPPPAPTPTPTPTPSPASSTVVSGHVYDADGVTPLKGLTVELRQFPLNTAIWTYTDAQGYYSLDPGPGIYRIYVVEGIFNRINGPDLPFSTPPAIVWDFALQEWV
jgi:hypothetical protein